MYPRDVGSNPALCSKVDMPNDFPYSIAHAPRKGPKITMGKGMQRVETPDPMQGVTDPATLLKSDTQRIDKNTRTPEQLMDVNPKLGGQEPIKKI